jgi:uncharacterized membrane protein required for colicin V production
MSVVDIVLVVWMLIALRIGWSNGLIKVLVTQFGVVIGILILHSYPDLLSGLFQPGTARIIGSVALMAVTGLIAGLFAGRAAAAVAHRIPLMNSIDRFAGAAGHAVITLVLAYIVLAGFISLDGLLQPIRGVASITSDQVSQLQANLASDPLASSLAGADGLNSLVTDTSKGPVSADQLGSYDQALAIYQQQVRPQLVSSKLAPYVLQFGRDIPFIGHDLQMPA